MANRTAESDVTVRLVFKEDLSAQTVVSKYNGQIADGKRLGVRIVGGSNASLSGRIGFDPMEGSVDTLLTDSAGGS